MRAPRSRPRPASCPTAPTGLHARWSPGAATPSRSTSTRARTASSPTRSSSACCAALRPGSPRPACSWSSRVASTPEDHARFLHYAAGGHVDGVLLISLHGKDELPERLEEHGDPDGAVWPPAEQGEEPVLRRRRQRGRGGPGDGAPHRQRAPGRRHRDRPAGHVRRPGPARRLPRARSQTAVARSVRS